MFGSRSKFAVVMRANMVCSDQPCSGQRKAESIAVAQVETRQEETTLIHWRSPRDSNGGIDGRNW
jgi:hypothetical protein